MSFYKIFGDFEETYDGKQIEWKIPNFSAVLVDEDMIESQRFIFRNASWYIRLWPRSISKYNCISLMIGAIQKHDYKVDYELGFKRKDNVVEQLATGTLGEGSVCTDYFFVEREDLKQRQNELLPRDTLTIRCYLKHGSILPVNSKLMELRSLDKLSDNFAELYTDRESSDITLIVQGNSFKAHKSVLIARSSVFRDKFREVDNLPNLVTGGVPKPFCIENCDNNTFETFLKFLYDAKLEELSPSSALQLYITSEEFKVQELKTFCSEYLKANLTASNLCDIVITAEKYENESLLSAVQHFFNKNLGQVWGRDEWKEFMVKNPDLVQKLMVQTSSKVRLV